MSALNERQRKFWLKVDKSSGPANCWIWRGAKCKFGYGRISGKITLAHRMSFFLTNGYLPEAVCHSCDNPSCVNPRHLIGGTRAFNNKDMFSKGRGWNSTNHDIRTKGEKHINAKLDANKIKEIRLKRSLLTQRQIAKEYGVSQRAIAMILRGITWSHVS